MNDKEDILVNAFRKKLKDYELPVDPGIWDSIENDLQKKSRNSRKTVFWKYAGIAASLLLALSLGLFFIHKPTINPKETIVTENKTVIPDTGHFDNNFSEETECPEVAFIDKKNVKHKPVFASVISNDKKMENKPAAITDDPDLYSETVPSITSATTKTETQPVNAIATEGKKQDLDNKKQQFAQLSDPDADLWIHSSKKGRKNNKMSFALAYGAPGSSSTTAINFPQGYADLQAIGSDNAYFYDIEKMTSINNELSKPTYDYKFPVSIGLSVRKQITEVLAIESGLTYTYLSSEETSRNLNTPISKKDIELNYIGIPLKMVWSFYQNNRLSIYLSGGGMVEKSISGSESVVTRKQSSTRDLDISELQWSVAGNLGVNFRLVQHLGIFVEPGVNYYFDDHSDVMTIRKDSPFNFSLQGGIRLSY